ncbi:Ca-activated chloride channel family protein [Alteromonadaceae bacterium Bs31]|nr:Ca-activated chloride channel family protein [Alteromonadaceae bacterium Bs31]
MIEFTYLWVLALLPLPLLIALMFPPFRESKDALQAPYFSQLVEVSGEKPKLGSSIAKRNKLQAIVLILGWLLLLLALARPEWVGAPVEMKKSARDLMLAVDLSGSMATEDFKNAEGAVQNRLEAVKDVLGEFISTRDGDRIGLIVFGDAPYLQAPFTQDRAVVETLLDETEVAMAGQSTAFGDAIGLAISVFQGSDTSHRVLIVLTDGNDNASKVPPVDASRVAAANKVTIYPIAMGDPGTVGEEAIDVEVLKNIAEISGGQYFEALDSNTLSDTYKIIDKLEPELYESLSYRPRESIFYYPLAAFALLFLFNIPLYIVLGKWGARSA